MKDKIQNFSENIEYLQNVKKKKSSSLQYFRELAEYIRWYVVEPSQFFFYDLAQHSIKICFWSQPGIKIFQLIN